ncbi:MAG TPA: tRNA (adenosine(37)-N6)-dimethylallyltransferase MiaA [Spirochaetota bacterium]|nr:tRNA (adenosine(37)-N6)-dimethylallyltransferase MiaA [Spirochaetota bacterium]HQO40786.1 tRNA (adenosine(37)-N6)-dimethylallyltransferase MiaA [Spirochaetota bacterium]
MENRDYNIIVITGPTACGKTSLAVKLALAYGCGIISGDSRQVFSGMDIGTGKDLDEYSTPSGRVPYYLIDIASPLEDYSLYRYLDDFNNAFRDVNSRGLVPLLAGGSGLYIEAALKGFSLPGTPADSELRVSLETMTIEELEALLMKESPEVYARTDRSSKRRVIRGIEIARSAESPGHAERTLLPELVPLIICINMPRDELVARIDLRLDQRISQGLVAEVRRLLESGVPHEKMIKLGLEYRYAAMHIAGEITLEQMTAMLRNGIHRFAKRQMTWFRGMERRGLKIHWINGADAGRAAEIIESHRYSPQQV